MRADFTLFDDYEHGHGSGPPFAFPLTAFWGSRDRRIKQAMVQASGGRWGPEPRAGGTGAGGMRPLPCSPLQLPTHLPGMLCSAAHCP